MEVHLHRQLAEKALGKPLPLGSMVHHVDRNPSNNNNNNLVLCEDAAYHSLIHKRQRVIEGAYFERLKPAIKVSAERIRLTQNPAPSNRIQERKEQKWRHTLE